MRTPQPLEPARDLLLTVSACETTLISAGHRVFGKVHDDGGVIDVALQNSSGRNAVIRFVKEPRDSDRVALKTMLAEGDFTRAAIVYTSEDQPHLSGEIETYPLSRLDELAASLARESAP
jgi:hypothetical protein